MGRFYERDVYHIGKGHYSGAEEMHETKTGEGKSRAHGGNPDPGVRYKRWEKRGMHVKIEEEMPTNDY